MNTLIYKTTNSALIRRIINHPDVKGFMFHVEPPEIILFDIKKLMSTNIVIYAMRFNNELIGIGIFSNKNGSIYVDIAFLPQCRGKNALSLATETLSQYIKEYCPSEILAKINKKNRRSLIFAKWMDFFVESEDEIYFYIKRVINHGRYY